MLVIAIDGACRRNGKPNCVASGGLFIQQYDDITGYLIRTETLSTYEVQSTNQRGELIALKEALAYILSVKESAHIVTDSEYLFNTMTKEWFVGWASNEWKTSTLSPVKNSDLWQVIAEFYTECKRYDIEVTFYHIKGHCVPFGKVTACSLLSADNTGKSLYYAVLKKYDLVIRTTRTEAINNANELSMKNNGFYLPLDKLKEFISINTVADAIATKCVDAADALMSK